MTTSRRAFLRNSSLAAAGVSLTAGLPLARGAHVAETSDKIKVGLIGAGGRGRGATFDCLKNCSNAKLVTICDAFEDQAQNTAKLFKEKLGVQATVSPDRIFSGFEGAQKVIDSDVDLVILATPPGFRPMHYKAAIEAGKHVFMEKPCCVDAPGFRTLQEANKLADKKNLKVGVGLQRHHQAPYLETIKRIKDGAIGDIQYFRVYWNSGGVWNRPRKPGQSEMEYQMQNWYYFVWLSGDHIAEQHVHNMDVANWIMDAHPVEATGVGGRQVRKFAGPQADYGHIFDHHVVEFTYADGTQMFSQCRHIPNTWSPVAEFAYGSKGYAQCENQTFKILTKDGGKWRFRGKSPRAYSQEHIDLMDAIVNDRPYNEGHYGATSSFTAVLGRMATYSGQPVTWDEAVKKGPSEMPEKFAWDANPPILPDKNGSYEHAVAIPGMYKPYQ